MSLLAIGLTALAIIGSLAGLYGTIHHSGVAEGRAEVEKRWEAQNAKNREIVLADRTRQESLRQATDATATRRLADERKRTSTLMVSLEAHIKAAGTSAQSPMPASLRDDWNLANAGPKGVGPGTVPPVGPKPAPAR